ncbi:hypothetical protein [Streptomyces sp. NPDC057496]|uniref:hypothetical protein n=1 Tax=Streptomyces sp. NPDC057496 TaxID=3346149 RepID=UPI0036ABCE2D
MTVPGIIPIKHEADYRTDTIGRWRGGQFFASVTGAFPEGWSIGDDWQEQKRWCAVLHRFDAAGRHLDSQIRVTGTTAGGEREAITAARLLLDQWLEDLPERRHEDIAIAPFTVRAEGILFGLVVEEGDGTDVARAEFLPDCLGFFAPWDGYYDT